MKNPAAIKQPKLKSPTERRIGRRGNKGKGNLPYLNFRRRLRKDLF